MKLFKSHEPNPFHYATTVCFNRVPVFRSEVACKLFISALLETREQCRFKLIGYVLMPDHAHLILNPLNRDISVVRRRLKSSSARQILDWLRTSNHVASLKKLALAVPQSRSHTHSLWQKNFSSIDLWSPQFIRQKLNYIHLNPSGPDFVTIRPNGNGQATVPIFRMSLAACQSRSTSEATGRRRVKNLLGHRRATPASKR